MTPVSYCPVCVSDQSCLRLGSVLFAKEQILAAERDGSESDLLRWNLQKKEDMPGIGSKTTLYFRNCS